MLLLMAVVTGKCGILCTTCFRLNIKLNSFILIADTVVNNLKVQLIKIKLEQWPFLLERVSMLQ